MELEDATAQDVSDEVFLLTPLRYQSRKLAEPLLKVSQELDRSLNVPSLPGLEATITQCGALLEGYRV